MPRTARRNRYSIPDCVQWRLDDLASAAGIRPDDVPEVVEARIQLYRAQHDHKRLETSRLAADSLPYDKVVAAVSELTQMYVAATEQYETRAAASYAECASEAEAHEILREHGRSVRQAICDRLESMARDFAAGEPDSETATEA